MTTQKGCGCFACTVVAPDLAPRLAAVIDKIIEEQRVGR